MPQSPPTSRKTKQGGCPICGQPARREHAPFCSRKCADVDLGRWLKGHYAIPTEDAPTADDGEDEAL